MARESRERRNFGELDLFIESPSGLSTSLSVDAPAFVRDFDVLDIGLDTQHVAGAQAMFDFESLYALFTESTRLFRPFWARVRDLDQIITDRIGNLHLSVDLTKVPDTIHWLNFFDERMVERLGGKEKLLAAPAYEVREWADPPGILLVLQREPFDYHAPEHRRRQEEIVKYLELEWLHTLYPKKWEVHSAGQWVSRR
ncbi:MAG: hypothetical protein QXQ53_09320 [Candidatus Methanosuratincola sp.]